MSKLKKEEKTIMPRASTPQKLMIGCKFFKVYQNFVTCHPFLSFLSSPFLPCKDTFMDDYDGI
jgi:hypothetical protein